MSRRNGVILMRAADRVSALWIAGLHAGETRDIYLLDMGSHKTPLMEGFTRVEPRKTYSPKAGFEWVQPGSSWQGIGHYDTHRTGKRESLDDLSVDYVLGRGAFLAPLRKQN